MSPLKTSKTQIHWWFHQFFFFTPPTLNKNSTKQIQRKTQATTEFPLCVLRSLVGFRENAFRASFGHASQHHQGSWPRKTGGQRGVARSHIPTPGGWWMGWKCHPEMTLKHLDFKMWAFNKWPTKSEVGYNLNIKKCFLFEFLNRFTAHKKSLFDIHFAKLHL